ncbi:hypothetical protein K474DRAFT_1664483, partial [Panus rudis PR-1116 ss-1]
YPPPSRSGLPHRRRRSWHSPQLNPSPAVLDPRPNERNPTYIPMFEVVVMMLELGGTPEDPRGRIGPTSLHQLAAHGDASDAGVAVSGKKAHRIFMFPWHGG